MMLLVPIFMLRDLPQHIISSAVHYTHDTETAIATEDPKLWVENQLHEFFTKQTTWIIVRVRELVKEHGGYMKFEAAGYESRMAVYYSIFRKWPVFMCHGAFEHVAGVFPLEEIFSMQNPDPYTVRLKELCVYLFARACDDAFKYTIRTNDGCAWDLARNSFLTVCTDNPNIDKLDVLPADWLDMPCKFAVPHVDTK